MVLVIDCFKLVKGTGKSIGIYNLTLNLVRNLTKDTKGNKIIILGTKYNRDDFDINGVKFVEVPYNPFNKIVCILWELVLVTRALKKINPDKVLFPRGFAPFKFLYKKGTYVIIHDMIPFYYHKNYPGVLNRFENRYIMWRLKASARAVTGVITDSENSKREIVKIAGINENKVYTRYPGFNLIEDVSETPIKGDYISAICSMLPHKNAEGVVRSYINYYKNADSPLNLVIIGLENVNAYNISNEIKEHITCIKYLEKDADMHGIIKGSKLFWFLSRQEGFGFPPLEAMQLGVPVICSEASSLPEVVGDAAILVNPEDDIQIAEETIKLLGREDISEFVNKGYKNVKRFMWDEKIEDYSKLLF